METISDLFILLFSFFTKKFRAHKNTNQQKLTNKNTNNRNETGLKLFLYPQLTILFLWSLYLDPLIFYLPSSVRIFFLWESFWTLLICENFFLFMIICMNLCLYKKKQEYECHHLKQIFCHQKQIMSFCWFRMDLFNVFYFKFFSFYVWQLFY